MEFWLPKVPTKLIDVICRKIWTILNPEQKEKFQSSEIFLPEGDICSALALISIMYSKLAMFRKACTAKIFALSGSKTCSTSNGWNNCTSPGQGSDAEN